MNVTSQEPFQNLRRYAGLGRKRVSVAWSRVALGMGRESTVRDEHHALAQLSSSSDVLVLCHGNICRSPLAERALRTELRASGLEDITVESAGFVEQEGRSSPDTAVTAAAEFGIDLSDHQSQSVSADLLQSSDLILLMDAYNFTLFRRRYDDQLDKACFLKTFTDGDGYEISDPYDTSISEFERVYGEVTDAVTAFVDRIEDAEP